MTDIQNPDHTSLDSARELSQLLLAPVAKRLRDRILIAGDGPIETLPFSLLPDPADDSKLLIDSHDVSYIPSIGAVLELRKRRRLITPVSELAVFADPVFDQNDSRVSGHLQSQPSSAVLISPHRGRAFPPSTALWRLPYASLEAQNVIAPVRHRRWSLYSGLAANRDNFLRVMGEGYRIIHVITHALNNDSDPALSGLVLSLVGSAGERRDGFLQLGTIYGSRVKADLIVLSACDTAEGEELRNEGLLGMTSAFLYAGAGRVLSTAWKIDDQATAELMGYFYRALYDSPSMSPAHALRVAQLQMRNVARWRTPYYWSGFLLHGDWSWKW